MGQVFPKYGTYMYTRCLSLVELLLMLMLMLLSSGWSLGLLFCVVRFILGKFLILDVDLNVCCVCLRACLYTFFFLMTME